MRLQRPDARLLLLLPLLLAPLASVAETRIGLFGDLPYTRWERDNFPALIARMGEARLDLGIHVGDIKGGGGECRDAVYRNIRAEFDQAAFPLVFVPGDNDWTDCHRWSNGGFDPLERLDFLRRVFYPGQETLGRQRLPLQRQAGYPENILLPIGPLLVFGLNLPGSGNNLRAPDGTEPNPEFVARTQANRAWLDEAFERAAAHAGMVIAIQANPRFDRDGELPRNAGYQPFIDQLRTRAAAYRKPVLLLHGDTHRVRIDQPLKDTDGRTLRNVQRIETFGSPRFGWIEISFSPDRSPAFQATPHAWADVAPPQ